jgi:hypothetical protein
MDYENKKFVSQRVRIDGNSYRGCSFTGCELVFGAGAPVILVGNSFTKCRFVFDEAAKLTLVFLAGLYPQATDLIEATLQSIRTGRFPMPPTN